MVAAVAELGRAVEGLGALWRNDPLSLIEWLPHQYRCLINNARFRLLRTGNRLGKTWVGLAEVIFAATGTHPFREPSRRAGEYWVVCASWSQSVAIQQQLWHLLPSARIHPDTKFNPIRGFVGKNPAVRVLHNDGRYSIIRIKTTQQGALSLAGDTIDGALFDEPPVDQSVFSEVQQRTRTTGGWVLLTLTPINAPVDWLREAVEEGLIEDIHARLEPSAMIPVGRSEPLRLPDQQGRIRVCDQGWIDDEIRLIPEHEVAIRAHGEWEARGVEAYFRGVWIEAQHVVRHLPDVAMWAQLGLDHGHRPGKQIAVLKFVNDEHPTGRPDVWIADEYSDETERGTPLSDAHGIVAMLRRNGLEWSDLAFVGGDRVHMKGTARQKSNLELMYAIAAVLDIDVGHLEPRIRTIKRGAGRGAGAVDHGCRWLRTAALEQRLHVHERCTRVRAAMDRFRIGVDDEFKDPVDGCRYGLDNYIFTRRPSTPATLRIG